MLALRLPPPASAPTVGTRSERVHDQAPGGRRATACARRCTRHRFAGLPRARARRALADARADRLAGGRPGGRVGHDRHRARPADAAGHAAAGAVPILRHRTRGAVPGPPWLAPRRRDRCGLPGHPPDHRGCGGRVRPAADRAGAQRPVVDQRPEPAAAEPAVRHRGTHQRGHADPAALVRLRPRRGAAAVALGAASNVISIGATAFGVLLQLFAVILVTFYLVADGPRARRALARPLPLPRRREMLAVWELAVAKTGGYLFSRLLLALLCGAAHALALILLDVPSWLPLALWVGLTSAFVPVVGTYLGGVLLLVVAAADEPVNALWLLAFIVVYQQLENVVLAPRVQAR